MHGQLLGKLHVAGRVGHHRDRARVLHAAIGAVDFDQVELLAKLPAAEPARKEVDRVRSGRGVCLAHVVGHAVDQLVGLDLDPTSALGRLRVLEAAGVERDGVGRDLALDRKRIAIGGARSDHLVVALHLDRDRGGGTVGGRRVGREERAGVIWPQQRPHRARIFLPDQTVAVDVVRGLDRVADVEAAGAGCIDVQPVVLELERHRSAVDQHTRDVEPLAVDLEDGVGAGGLVQIDAGARRERRAVLGKVEGQVVVPGADVGSGHGVGEHLFQVGRQAVGRDTEHAGQRLARGRGLEAVELEVVLDQGEHLLGLGALAAVADAADR